MMNIKITDELFYIFLSNEVLEIQCAFYTNSTSQFRLATFQVVSSYLQVAVATLLDSTALRL